MWRFFQGGTSEINNDNSLGMRLWTVSAPGLPLLRLLDFWISLWGWDCWLEACRKTGKRDKEIRQVKMLQSPQFWLWCRMFFINKCLLDCFKTPINFHSLGNVNFFTTFFHMLFALLEERDISMFVSFWGFYKIYFRIFKHTFGLTKTK